MSYQLHIRFALKQDKNSLRLTIQMYPFIKVDNSRQLKSKSIIFQVNIEHLREMISSNMILQYLNWKTIKR
jgi:hypothetical protein